MSQQIREHSFPDETYQVGIDFDGVIHRCSKGFYDGTIYDPPIEGSKEALKVISKKFDIVVYSAKARADRPLINGMTGGQLIWEWLDKYEMSQYVKEVTLKNLEQCSILMIRLLGLRVSGRTPLDPCKSLVMLNEKLCKKQ